jgi:hypothetical protein
MDGTPNSILPDDLYARLGTASVPIVLDVRPGDDFSADVRVIVSAIPWDVVCERPRLADLPTGKPLVVYCAFAGPVFASATAAGARR